MAVRKGDWKITKAIPRPKGLSVAARLEVVAPRQN